MFYALITMRDGSMDAMTCTSASFTVGELVILRGDDDGGPKKVAFDLALVREIEVRTLRDNIPLIRKSYPFALHGSLTRGLRVRAASGEVAP